MRYVTSRAAWPILAAVALLLVVPGCRKAAPPRSAVPATTGGPVEPGPPPPTEPPPAVHEPGALPGGGEPQPSTPSSSPARAARNVAWTVGLDLALGTAKQQGRPVLAVCVYRDVGGSALLRGQAFQDPELSELAQRFVCVIVDLEKDTEAAKRLQTKAAPTVLVLSPSGDVLARMQGYGSPRALAGVLRAGLRAYGAGEPRGGRE